jgi:hypothetical protein
MGFRNNAYATVWKKIQRETKNGSPMFQINLTTQKKNKDGSYTKDFSGFASLFGKANEKATDLDEKDVIKILECDVNTNYVKSTGKNYTNFVIFDFEIIKKGNGSTSNSSGGGIPDINEEITDDVFGAEVPF